ncbi:MAG: PIN domain-containing protein [Leptospira sp.]|nr:PIN domain-containing protein [Leptospira sp.]
MIIDNDLIYDEAQKVSLNYTQNHGLRSLDILHLATAKLLNCEFFLTNDTKQSTIAKKMGFKIPL